jgi:hypothetical protein
MVEIPGYNGRYLLDEHGGVFSKAKNRLLKPTLSSKGYYILTLDKKQRYLHQLYAETVFDDDYKSKGLVVDHIDRNPLNNDIKNLRLVSKSENAMNVDRKMGECIFERTQGDYRRYCVIIQKNGIRIHKSFKTYKDALSYRNKIEREIESERINKLNK